MTSSGPSSSLPADCLPVDSLPADGHVHSQWSWDTSIADMERTCARAVAIGLPAVAFTEHVDHSRWPVQESGLVGHEHLARHVRDGVLIPPPLDVEGYLECLERCRSLFPGLRILSGAELGEPHWNAGGAASVLARAPFERILGSLHGLRLDGEFHEMPEVHRLLPADDLMRRYLREVAVLVTCDVPFAVLAHLDYPVRYWRGPFEPSAFEEEFRDALAALAASGRALEVNTRNPLHPQVVRWWRECGGEAVTFGSDAHKPDLVGHGFADAAAMVESCGFRPGRDVVDAWVRA